MSIEALMKLAEQKKLRPASSGESKFLQIEYGETVVRFLPAKDGKSVFFKEFGEHWIDRKRYFCPRMTNKERCPICETVAALYEAGDNSSIEVARQFKARKQNYANVIVRGKEDEGPKIFKFGKKLGESILDWCVEEKIDLSDPKAGKDFRIVKKKDGEFPNYDRSRPVSETSKLDASDLEDWMEKAEDIHSWVNSEVLSYDQIKAAFDGVSGSESKPTKSDTVAKAVKSDVTKNVSVEDFDEDKFLNDIDEAVS